MALENIVVKGAREHNLKNIDVTIPRDQLIVITGPKVPGQPHLPMAPGTFAGLWARPLWPAASGLGPNVLGGQHPAAGASASSSDEGAWTHWTPTQSWRADDRPTWW